MSGRAAYDLGLAARLARREMRTGLKPFSVFLACLALGVAMVAAVGQLSAMVEASVALDAKRLLGGDVSVRTTYMPLGADTVDYMQKNGRLSLSATMRTMARTNSGAASLVELKAVDQEYPLVGVVGLDPAGSLTDALAEADGLPGAVADPALFQRLGLALGDRILLGRQAFRLAGRIAFEPDKASTLFGLGPRLVIPLSALDKTGLTPPGALLRRHYKLLLPKDADAAAFAERLERTYPEPGMRVRTFRDPIRGVDRAVDDLATYLSMVGLAALLVGGVGMAQGVKSHLRTRLNAIAAMKCLGAPRRVVVWAYLIQIAALALAGVALGLGLGVLAALGAGKVVAGAVNVDIRAGVHAAPLAVAGAFGLLTALAFSLIPLSSASRVAPARLFARFALPLDTRPGPVALALTLACLAGFAGLVLAFSNDPRAAFGFTGGMAASLAALALLGRIIKWTSARLPEAGDFRLRRAVSGLARSGSRLNNILYSLGLGLVVLTAVTQIQANLSLRLGRQMPEKAPSYFFLNIPSAEIKDFMALVESQPGVARTDHEPSLRGRIVRVNGTPADEVEAPKGSAWALRGDRGLTFASEKPDKVVITSGEWWPPDHAGTPLVSFDAKVARDLGLEVGHTLTVSVPGREITARIANLREIDWSTLGLNHMITFAPGAVDQAPHTYLATAYVEPGGEHRLFQTVSRAFPTVAAVYVKDVLDQVIAFVRKVGLGVKTAAMFAVAVGLIVVGQALRAALAARRFELTVFKVLGASRRDVLALLAMEFALVGLAAAVAAMALGALLAFGVVAWVMEAEFTLAWLPLLLTALGGMAACLALGLAHVRAVLDTSPMEMLRNE